MQRGDAASVPRMRTRRRITGTVIASGTPRGVALASSEQWKSTRYAAQQAPQRTQLSSLTGAPAIVPRDLPTSADSQHRPATLLVLLAATARTGVVTTD